MISFVRMPFFDDWQLGCLKNERNISLIARDGETNTLQGVIIMEYIHAEYHEYQEPEHEMLRHKRCPDKMAAIFAFLNEIKSDLNVAEAWVNLLPNAKYGGEA